MNSETLQYIQDNYAHILKKSSKLGTREQLEDALSEIVIRLLTKSYDIDNPQAFIHRSMFNYIAKSFRNSVAKNSISISNMKDGLLSDLLEEDETFMNLISPCIFKQMEEEGELNIKMELFMNLIDRLPAGQKDAIINFFKYEKTSLVPGNPNTNKANFRWATLKLKEMYNECK